MPRLARPLQRPDNVSTAIVWFRRDLRVHDNPALTGAIANGRQVVPLFVLDDDAGGGASRWWLHHSLRSLQQGLERHGSRLILRQGRPLDALRTLVRQVGATEVHWNRLYEPAAAARDAAIKQALNRDGVAVFSHGSHLLHEPEAARTQAGQPYRVFTPFWKAVLAGREIAPPLPAPARLVTPPLKSPTLQSLQLLPHVDWAEGFSGWEPGEPGALARLRHFVDNALSGYAANRDFPARAGTSRLSPHLHFGEITPAQAWHAALAAEAPDVDREAFLRELGWREFAHNVLWHFPETEKAPLYAKYRDFPWRDDHDGLLRAWQRGETGYPVVDAGMRELWRTGWMHNRVRMVVASLLVKNLRVPWQEGAAWFMDTLVDADLASNTLNWQWAAGCGADAAPYFRIFNPVTQSEKFEAADYIREHVPELRGLPDRWIHKPWEVPATVQRETGFVPGRDYPLPVVDYRESREEALAALRALTANSNGD